MRRIQFVLALSLFTLQTSIQGCLGFSSIQTQRILKKGPNFKSQNTNKNAFTLNRISNKESFGRCVSMEATPSVIESIGQTLTIFSSSAMSSSSPAEALVAITEVLSTTPPSAYFLSLVAAGFGVPISEDAMCIFAGTTLSTLHASKRNTMILALYAGVVLSDIITFSIGKALGKGLLQPLSKKMGLQKERVNFCDDQNLEYMNILKDEEEEVCVIPNPSTRKRDRVLAKLEKAGDLAGFAIRFSVGFRAPMMLAAGFSNKISTLKYMTGTMLGAVCSLTLQLLLGFCMRNNPTAVLGAIASISTVVAVVPITLAIGSSMSVIWSKFQLRQSGISSS